MSIFLKILQLDNEQKNQEFHQILKDVDENEEKLDLKKINEKGLMNKMVKKSKNNKLIGGYKPEIYTKTPETYLHDWVFYIPRTDFNKTKYLSILPPSLREHKSVYLSYGKLLPESYYYGKLTKLNGKYFIDIDKTLINPIMDQRINQIYLTSLNEFDSIPSCGYPKSYDLVEYLNCVEIIKAHPEDDWSSLIPENYQLIYGGNKGFENLVISEATKVNY
jgi:hypothetical protein